MFIVFQKRHRRHPKFIDHGFKSSTPGDSLSGGLTWGNRIWDCIWEDNIININILYICYIIYNVIWYWYKTYKIVIINNNHSHLTVISYHAIPKRTVLGWYWLAWFQGVISRTSEHWDNHHRALYSCRFLLWKTSCYIVLHACHIASGFTANCIPIPLLDDTENDWTW